MTVRNEIVGVGEIQEVAPFYVKKKSKTLLLHYVVQRK